MGVEADFGDYRGAYSEAKKEKRFSTSEEAEPIAATVRGKTGIITESTQKPFTEMPPQLYDLTTLQREANKRFGLTAKRTLNAAQSLYEKYKYITYPRTESRYLTFNLKPKVKQALESLPEPYNAYAKDAIPGLTRMKGGRVFRGRAWRGSPCADPHRQENHAGKAHSR